MRKKSNWIFLLAAILLLGMVILTGCPSGGKKQENGGKVVEETGPKDIGSAEGTETDDGQGLSDRLANQGLIKANEMTLEEIDALTQYGAIRFPGAELIPNASKHQELGDVEIFNFSFGTKAVEAEVAEWYRQNLEKGTQETSSNLADGSKVTNFNYEDEAKDYTKSINIIGVPGGDATTIKVMINSKVKAAIKEGEEAKKKAEETE